MSPLSKLHKLEPYIVVVDCRPRHSIFPQAPTKECHQADDWRVQRLLGYKRWNWLLRVKTLASLALYIIVDFLLGVNVHPAFSGYVCRLCRACLKACHVCYVLAREKLGNDFRVVFPYLLLNRQEICFNIERGA